jgi:ribosomal protein S18 acetylase RimI-like enzyme
MNATAIRLQPLRPQDVAKLHRLFVDALDADFSYIDEAHRTKIKRQNSKRHLALTILKPNRVVILAWHRDDLVGYIIAGLAPNHSSNIDWLYMKPDLRGNNVGLKLLSRAMRALMERGANNVTLVTHAYTDYYARQGFRMVRRVMSDGIEQDLMRFDF